MAYAIAFGIALIVTYVITPAVKRLACRVGAMDNPNARKVHHGAVPRLGGLGIYIGFLASVLYSLPLSTEVIGLLMGSAVIIAVGVWDDICQIPAKVKLLGQILAAVVLVACGVRVDWILNPLGDYIYLSAFISVPLTILWVVGFTNMVNLIDGLDGLAAGVSSIAAVSVALIAYQMGQWNSVAITVAMAGAAIGFLQYNFNPAKIFMGDTGSMFLGYTLAAVSIMGVMKTAATVALVVPVIALGLPIMDTALAIVRRKLSGMPIFAPDRGHLHHRLLDSGLSQKQVVLLMYAITAFLGMIALLVVHLNVVFGVVVVGVVTAAGLWWARYLGMIAGGKCASEKH
ncbi:MAG: MraY family glycosyltransferase [Negativicoccus succinicivorans]|nr:MraY family glycosyltransferase [Negativicoccus succinicivorans]